MSPASNLNQLTMLNNDVTNSADFATILSIFGVANGPYGLASGIFSANPKDVTVILHEFGHTFGGQHSFDNKHNDPKKGYAFGYDYKNKFGTPLSYSNQPLYYWSNPRINHPKLGVPLGHENANDMARYITEERFSLNRGDESRACYTCNAYSGERFYRNTHLTFTGCFLAKKKGNNLVQLWQEKASTIIQIQELTPILFLSYLYHSNQFVHLVGKNLETTVMDLHQDI